MPRNGARGLCLAALLAATAATACAGNRTGDAADAPATDAGTETGAAAETGARGGGADARADARADTARGVVAVVGADPITRVVLRTPGGQLPLRGAVADTLRGLAGVEVRVSGTREDDAFAASSFRVRSVDGMAADDGVLELDGDMAVLVGPDGTRSRWGPAPAGLRRLVGRRVWIAGTRGETLEAWGLIGPAR